MKCIRGLKYILITFVGFLVVAPRIVFVMSTPGVFFCCCCIESYYFLILIFVACQLSLSLTLEYILFYKPGGSLRHQFISMGGILHRDLYEIFYIARRESLSINIGY